MTSINCILRKFKARNQKHNAKLEKRQKHNAKPCAFHVELLSTLHNKIKHHLIDKMQKYMTYIT